MITELARKIAFAAFMTGKALWSPTALGVSALVENAEGRILLCRHSYMPGWSLPGGGAGRGEPLGEGIMRELREEVGLVASAAPEFFGLYTRGAGWATNTIALFRVGQAQIDFKPNLEIREILFVDPRNPPDGMTSGTMRRLAELTGQAPQSPYW